MQFRQTSVLIALLKVELKRKKFHSSRPSSVSKKTVAMMTCIWQNLILGFTNLLVEHGASKEKEEVKSVYLRV